MKMDSLKISDNCKKMRTDAYKIVGIERYDALCSNYLNFLRVVSEEKMDPVTVFAPLTEKQMNELTLIREISQELQKKKDDDLKKAAEAAAAQPEEIAVEEKVENKEEEKEVSEVVEGTQEENKSE